MSQRGLGEFQYSMTCGGVNHFRPSCNVFEDGFDGDMMCESVCSNLSSPCVGRTFSLEACTEQCKAPPPKSFLCWYQINQECVSGDMCMCMCMLHVYHLDMHASPHACIYSHARHMHAPIACSLHVRTCGLWWAYVDPVPIL